jgi:predicted nuclease of restriction endonuclease-like (RecB) superfamily
MKEANSNLIIEQTDTSFVGDLKIIVGSAREYSYRAANLMQVVSNWLVGWRIVEQEQQGSKRAEYGKHVIALASKALTEEFGKGYSETNIRSFRRFYLEFKDIQIQQTVSAEFREKIFQIQQTISAESDGNTNPLPIPLKGTIEKENVQTLSSQLSWSHYERLMRVSDLQAREWYLKEAVSQQWNFHTLKRNIDTQYYYRLMQTPDAQKQVVIDEMQTMTADFQKEKSAFVKNPMLVEFLGLNQDISLTETDLETSLLNHLRDFLMELGKGYAFVTRQQHIHTDDDDYYIDLVFYNYILKCFILIDLKTTKVSYQDVGQMDMYLKMYDTYKRREGDSPTIGIILCAETNADVARFSTLATNKQMYAAKYLTYMPTKEELRREIERQKEIFMLQQNNSGDTSE